MKLKEANSSINNLNLSKIILDREIQPRMQLNQEVVSEYAEAMRQGATFPPVAVYCDGKKYWLADGFLRLKAKEYIGGHQILSEVKYGSRRDAILFAAGANSAYGLQRSNADKRRAVEKLIFDEEWFRWSDREIARRTFVSQPFVSKLRSQYLEGDNCYQIDVGMNISCRLACRNGKPYNVNVANIGQSKRPKKSPSLHST